MTETGRSTDLRIGYVPLIDAAGVLALAHKGFAEAEGLRVTLTRERSWAATRDRLSAGRLDAAHMLAPVAVASRMGLAHANAPLAVPLMLSANGNEVTVSRDLAALCDGRLGYRPKGPGQWGAVLADLVRAGAACGAAPFTIATVFGFSSHYYLVRRWLAEAGIEEGMVRLVVVPPPLMGQALANGTIDAFCAGPPWGRLAEDAHGAVLAFRAVELARDVPEKALAIRDPLHPGALEPDVIARLVRAAYAASQWADARENRDEVVKLLAHAQALNAPERLIGEAFDRSGLRFAGPGVNRPGADKARWMAAQIDAWNGDWSGGSRAIPDTGEAPRDHASALQAFRADLFDAALAQAGGETAHAARA